MLRPGNYADSKRLPAISFLPILKVSDVAVILGCSVDRVRRIPLSDLPWVKGPGRSNLYLLDDVIAFVRRCQKAFELDDLTFMERSRQAEFLAEEIRKSGKTDRSP